MNLFKLSDLSVVDINASGHITASSNISASGNLSITGNADIGFIAQAQVWKNGGLSKGSMWKIPKVFHSIVITFYMLHVSPTFKHQYL